MSVYIAVPCANQARYSAFWISLQNMDKPQDTIIDVQMGPFIVNNQNSLARRFLKTSCQWFFLANDDQIYQPDTLTRLLSHDLDAVVGFCVSRKPPHSPLLYDHMDGNFVQHSVHNGESGLIPIGASGGGSLLLKRSVLERVGEPWWTVNSTPNGDHGGEDFAFCHRMHNTGIQLWCDLDTPIGHIADFALTPVRHPDGNWQVALTRTNS